MEVEILGTSFVDEDVAVVDFGDKSGRLFSIIGKIVYVVNMGSSLKFVGDFFYIFILDDAENGASNGIRNGSGGFARVGDDDGFNEVSFEVVVDFSFELAFVAFSGGDIEDFLNLVLVDKTSVISILFGVCVIAVNVNLGLDQEISEEGFVDVNVVSRGVVLAGVDESAQNDFFSGEVKIGGFMHNSDVKSSFTKGSRDTSFTSKFIDFFALGRGSGSVDKVYG